MTHTTLPETSATDTAPHAGELLQEMLELKGVSRADLSRKMGVSGGSVTLYCKRSNLPFATLWVACVALKYNLFADLAARFPFPPEADNPLQKRIDELQRDYEKRIYDLEHELGIYKSIVSNKS